MKIGIGQVCQVSAFREVALSNENSKKPQSPYNQHFGIPNYFQCPNLIVDELLPLLDNSELRVLLAIVRQTIGWHKPWDRLSSSQLAKVSGCSPPTAIKAATGLEEKGHILVRYICPNCKKITDPPENKGKEQKFEKGHIAPECSNCKSTIPPQKWYALNVKDEDMDAYLLWIIETGNTDDDTLKNLTGGIKGFNRGVLKDLIGGYKGSLYTKDIYKDNKESIDESVIKKLNKEEQEVRELPAKKPDLLSKLEFLPGIINLTKEEDKRYFEYIKEYNETQVDTVIDEAKRRTKLPSSDKERLQRKSVLKFIAGGLENYDVFYNKTKSGDVMKLDNSIILEAKEEMAKLQEQVQKDIKEAGGEAEYRGKLDELINGFVKGE